MARIERSVVHPALCHAVLRMLWLDVRTRGLPHDELMQWYTESCPFPHLRFEPEVVLLRQEVERALTGRLVGQFSNWTACEPQFIFQLPDTYRDEAPPHVDTPPPWAEHGEQYALIAGVALNNWTMSSGSPWLHLARRLPTTLSTGDVLLLNRDTLHSVGNNRSHEVRAGVYYRWLTK